MCTYDICRLGLLGVDDATHTHFRMDAVCRSSGSNPDTTGREEGWEDRDMSSGSDVANAAESPGLARILLHNINCQ